MASTISPPLKIFSIHRAGSAPSSSSEVHVSKHAPAIPKAVVSARRQLLFFLTASTALTARERAFAAQDIPLFGLRKSLKKAEEEAEVIVREGFEAAEKGLETAERGIETAEKGIEAAERGIESAEKEVSSVVSFGGLEQAGIVAGAEVLGVLVATTLVSSILGPEAQRS